MGEQGSDEPGSDQPPEEALRPDVGENDWHEGGHEVLDPDDPGTMRWFGTSWGAPMNYVESQIETPVGVLCMCGRAFQQGDRGIQIPHLGSDRQFSYFHLEPCWMRSILGDDWELTLRKFDALPIQTEPDREGS